MLDFYHQRFNVLMCSTIIESGIDVPSANTILIERADKFGLAQLHQLRGRVGRSHHRAYCYLLVPDGNAMTPEARKRLEAIASLEELGAGFMLASHDLEIRGAGELLGETQSGVIDEIGFSLYAELLERAVQSLKAGGTIDTAEIGAGDCEINLHVPALLPDDYLPDVHLRLVLYKRIAGATTAEELVSLKEEIIDRFGALPSATERLFGAAALKMLATPLGIRRIDAGPKGARIEFSATPNIDPASLIALLQSAPRRYRLDGPNKLRILDEMPEPEDRLKNLRALMERLGTDDGSARLSKAGK
jgi:transcription-repair coupling factor (superfamily II helicase)